MQKHPGPNGFAGIVNLSGINNMAGINQQECTHSQFTGYDGYCVCIGCGWIITYADIKLEKNDDSLAAYIKRVLLQSPPGKVEFDVGVAPQGVVNDHSPNRIRFTIQHNPKIHMQLVGPGVEVTVFDEGEKMATVQNETGEYLEVHIIKKPKPVYERPNELKTT